MKERELKDYIIKLNDRNIQRQRETGFTLYAMIGIIFLCLFQILDNLNMLNMVFNDERYMCVFIFISNSIFVIAHIFFPLFYKDSFSYTKIYQNKELFDTSISEFIILLIPILFIGAINFFFVSSAHNLIHRIYLIVFGIILLLNLITPLIIKVYREKIEDAKAKKGIDDKISFTLFTESLRNKAVKTTTISFIIYLVLSLITFFQVTTSINVNDFADLLKFSIYFYGLFILLEIAKDIKHKQDTNQALEEFEKEIFIDNLPDSEIRKKFEKEFDGIKFDKWLENTNAEIKDFFDLKRNQIQECLAVLIAINELQLALSFHEKYHDLLNYQEDIFSEANKFIQRIRIQFKNLADFASLTEEERQSLNLVNASFVNLQNEFLNIYFELNIRTINKSADTLTERRLKTINSQNL